MIALTIALIFCLFLSAFFSSAEMALFSLSPMKIRSFQRDSHQGRRLAARLLSHPRSLLVTLLMGNTLANILIQNIAANLFPQRYTWLLSVGLPLILTMVFGEIIPKSIAMLNNERFAPKLAFPLMLFYRLVRPIRHIFTAIAETISRSLFLFFKPERIISKEELFHALQVSYEQKVLTKQEADLVRGYLKFQEATIKELMRPREEILSYDLLEPLSRLSHLFCEEECSRVPITEGGYEKVLGIIEANDFFLAKKKIHTSRDLIAHLHHPFFVPEGMKAATLLRKFGEKGLNLALVVDEYGSLTGLVTREDLIETVVGEIVDQQDTERLYTWASPDVIIASGKLELAQLNELFSTHVKSDENRVTVAGWLTERIGYLPSSGMRYETDEFLFQVLFADPNRIKRLYIRRLANRENHL